MENEIITTGYMQIEPNTEFPTDASQQQLDPKDKPVISNPYKIPEIKSSFLFNSKLYKKQLRKRYQNISRMSRFLQTNKAKEFEKLSKAIIDVVHKCLLRDDIFKSGNYMFIMTVMEQVMSQSVEVSKTIQNLDPKDIDHITRYQDVVMNKNKAALGVLFQNVYRPNTIENYFENIGEERTKYFTDVEKQSEDTNA